MSEWWEATDRSVLFVAVGVLVAIAAYVRYRWNAPKDVRWQEISAGLVLFLFWFLLSGYLEAFLIGIGAASAVAVVVLANRMAVIDHEGHPIHLGWRVITYWPWLLKEIAKSAWDVARIIISPRLPVSPQFVRVAPSQKTEIGVVTYANSITLTPGTISVDVRPDEILVHALTQAGAQALAEGEMDRRVTRFEGHA